MHANKELIFDGVTVHIIFKSNKHSYLKLKKDGSILLTVPYDITLTNIQTILSKNVPKLKPRIEDILRKEQRSHQIDKVRYLGVELDHTKLEISISNNSELTLWYKAQADKVFKERYEHCLSLISHWNIKSVPKLKIKRMTTRFGSYSRHTHTIALSLWLIKFPIELIDYVIYHELVHLIHFNHSSEFYKLFESICPHWKIYKQELKQLSNLYGFSD